MIEKVMGCWHSCCMCQSFLRRSLWYSLYCRY